MVEDLFHLSILHFSTLVFFITAVRLVYMSVWNWSSNGPSVHPPDDSRVNMEQRYNCIGRKMLKNSEKNPPQYHFVHNKFHMD